MKNATVTQLNTTKNICVRKVRVLKNHPATACVPEMGEAEFAAIKTDIQQCGQRVAIHLMDGRIVDGRARYRACAELGIDPITVELGKDAVPEEVINSLNLLRRHMTDSQRAIAGARLVTTRLGSNQTTKDAMSQGVVAQRLAVSVDSLQRAGKVLAANEPVLVKKVEAGELSVSEAENIVKLPKPSRQKVMAAANDENFRSVAKAAVTTEKHAATRQAVAKKRAKNSPLDTVPDTYEVLYIDPPWNYLSEDKTGYPTMKREQLLELDVASKVADNAVCFMWVPCSQLPLALELMKEWGFEYKTHAVWDKVAPGTGTYFQGRHEILLLGTRGIVPATPPKSRSQSIFAEKRREHSRKPEAAYVLIESMYPRLSKLEMFARGKARPGWTVWGNEAIPATAAVPVKVKPAALPESIASGQPIPKATKRVVTKKPEGMKAANEAEFRMAA
jgi:N6-adenosine-specific RNA methylase IME4